MAFKDLFSFLFQRSTQEERVAQYVVREHDRGRSAARDPRGQVRRQPSPVTRAALPACSTGPRSSTRSAETWSRRPRPLSRPRRAERALRAGANRHARPPVAGKGKRPSGKGRFGMKQGRGWDAPSIGGDSASLAPRSGDSRSTRSEPVALLLERIRLVVVSEPFPEARLVVGRAARSRAATWRSSRSTFPGRRAAADSRARRSTALRRHALRAPPLPLQKPDRDVGGEARLGVRDRKACRRVAVRPARARPTTGCPRTSCRTGSTSSRNGCPASPRPSAARPAAARSTSTGVSTSPKTRKSHPERSADRSRPSRRGGPATSRSDTGRRAAVPDRSPPRASSSRPCPGTCSYTRPHECHSITGRCETSRIRRGHRPGRDVATCSGWSRTTSRCSRRVRPARRCC